MPVYDYRCTQCNHDHQIRHSMATPVPACPDCGSTLRRRILTAPAVHGNMARGRELAVRSLPEVAHGKGCPCCSGATSGTSTTPTR